MRFSEVTLRLPDWLDEVLPTENRIFSTQKQQMEFVIGLAERNIANGSGGPFAAAVFDLKDGRLIAPGVNLVSSANCSVAHAEIVAISIAQKVLGSYDLSADGMPRCALVTSTAPCAMCLGAIGWSGLREVVCGARDEDARAIGFDEGDKPADWVTSLQNRRITVVTDVLRDRAKGVLLRYKENGGVIYNCTN